MTHKREPYRQQKEYKAKNPTYKRAQNVYAAIIFSYIFIILIVSSFGINALFTQGKLQTATKATIATLLLLSVGGFLLSYLCVKLFWRCPNCKQSLNKDVFMSTGRAATIILGVKYQHTCPTCQYNLDTNLD